MGLSSSHFLPLHDKVAPVFAKADSNTYLIVVAFTSSKHSKRWTQSTAICKLKGILLQQMEECQKAAFFERVFHYGKWQWLKDQSRFSSLIWFATPSGCGCGIKANSPHSRQCMSSHMCRCGNPCGVCAVQCRCMAACADSVSISVLMPQCSGPSSAGRLTAKCFRCWLYRLPACPSFLKTHTTHRSDGPRKPTCRLDNKWTDAEIWNGCIKIHSTKNNNKTNFWIFWTGCSRGWPRKKPIDSISNNRETKLGKSDAFPTPTQSLSNMWTQKKMKKEHKENFTIYLLWTELLLEMMLAVPPRYTSFFTGSSIMLMRSKT